jgi:hypothetical protein
VTTPRRRIVRPGPLTAPSASPQRIQKVRDKLDRERAALDRWMSRLKRAFNASQKHQRHVAHLERRIRHLENH